MNEVKHKVALEDILNNAELPEFNSHTLMAEVKAEVEAFCENEDISLGQINMLETLKTAEVVITIVPFEGLS